MSEIPLLPLSAYGRQFVPADMLPRGADEYYLRDAQVRRPPGGWRALRAEEIEALIRNRNVCGDWSMVLAADPFLPHLVRDCEFYGLVRIGRLTESVLDAGGVQAPVGLYHSRIVACDLGENVAVHRVELLAHYILGDRVIVQNVGRMTTSPTARFGNGAPKDGQGDDACAWMDVANECGGRRVLAFEGMTPADACIWARRRDNETLMRRLTEMTRRAGDGRWGFYGTVGDESVIANCGEIADVRVGARARIDGAGRLCNLTIDSAGGEETHVGDGVELVDGIVSAGCAALHGSRACRFAMGKNSRLMYGARLIHTYLGDNSTVACCEVLNNLIFPAHEQHHNNSFLIASTVLGQSNIAAGATVGSNHNSRAPDGEVLAGRGFWPGLCTSLKHCCRFASFVLLAKGDYPHELNVELPFALVSDDATNGRLLVMPAYWWMYNMYALSRNTWKFRDRDKRRQEPPAQRIEFDFLAPDTVEEMFAAMSLLEHWTAQAAMRGSRRRCAQTEMRAMGRQLLSAQTGQADKLEVLAEGVENSRRPVLVLKAAAGYRAYRQMIHYYAVRELMGYMRDHGGASVQTMSAELAGPRERQWVNLGGQLVPADDAERLLADITTLALDSWQAVHRRYEGLWEAYPDARRRHAMASLLAVTGARRLTAAAWRGAISQALLTQRFICEQVLVTRSKDYDDPFRQTTFRNDRERQAVLGTPQDNAFVKRVREETELFARLAAELADRD